MTSSFLRPLHCAVAIEAVDPKTKKSYRLTGTINGKEYIDYEYSEAFAMVDHQVAHVYMNKSNKIDKQKIKIAIEDINGIDMVCDEKEKQNLHIDHARSGELIAIAEKDKWFSYYWWYDDQKIKNSNPDDTKNNEIEKAPSFTKTVDIHRKPGYDPLDLFIDPKRKCISTDTSLIRGSHGRPFSIESGEGLSAFVSNKKIEHIDKEIFDGHPVINCLDIFEIVRKNFV